MSDATKDNSSWNKIKIDPVKHLELKKEKGEIPEEKKEGAVKAASDVSKWEQRDKRRQWKENQRNRWEKMKKALAMQASLSPATDASQPDEADLPATFCLS